MANATNIKQGVDLPIALQISDGATDQYPQAEMRDPDGTLLETFDLTHDAEGLYLPSLSSGQSLAMPDETFVIITYIVYEDAGHSTESDLYLRDADVFVKVDPDDYKADVSALATEANATANKNEIITEVNENETKIDNIQTDLDNPNQYKADVSSLAIEANVEGHVTDALNSYDPPTKAELDTAEANIIAEVDANETKIDNIQSDIDNATYGLQALKNIFDQIKGVGWTTETLKAIYDAVLVAGIKDWTAAELKQIRDALGIDGDKTTASGGQLQRILGLVHENFRIFDPVYDGNNNLTSATVKVYATATNCNNDLSPIATYGLVATYDGNGLLATYKMVRN